MCGLVGLVTNHFNSLDVDKFKDLLLFSSTRGKHSTGVVSVTADIPFHAGRVSTAVQSDFYYAKAPVNPIEFMEYPEFSTLMNAKDGKALLGHTRYATKGAVNAENAHPFISRDGSTIGMHNGTLVGDYKYKDQFDTDSEALINILAEDGPEALRHINGAWALVWYDWFNNKLNIIRNNERTLYYHRNAIGDMIYASEEWMIETTVKRNVKWDKSEPVIKALPAYKLLQFDFNTSNFRDTYTIEDVKGLEAPKVTYYHNSRFHGFNGTYGDWALHEDREWEDVEDTVPFDLQQQQSSRAPVHSLLSAREALKQTVQKRKEAGQAGKKETAQAGKAQRSNLLEYGGAEDSDVDLEQHYIKGISERQKVDVDSGHLFIETVPGEWLHEDHFLECAVNNPCYVCGVFKDINQKREWLSREEFICIECCDTDVRPVTNMMH